MVVHGIATALFQLPTDVHESSSSHQDLELAPVPLAGRCCTSAPGRLQDNEVLLRSHRLLPSNAACHGCALIASSFAERRGRRSDLFACFSEFLGSAKAKSTHQPTGFVQTNAGSAGNIVPFYDGDFRFGPPSKETLARWAAEEEALDQAPVPGLTPSCADHPVGWIKGMEAKAKEYTYKVGKEYQTVSVGAQSGHCYWGNSSLTPGDFPGPSTVREAVNQASKPMSPPPMEKAPYTFPSGPATPSYEKR
mmetsp:Transcript_158550/g.304188  ORF Transcript_158550/g.304188 Transcript_158550/m.304188 type:complete len:250 (-) Transcript_158550:39-788(-)